MALDRPEDEAGPDPPGRRARPDPPGGADGPADAEGPTGSHAAGRTVEARSRTEYYEALRVADGKPVNGSSAASDRSGWDSVDARERPPPEAIRVGPERAAHILDGDRTGGGHRHGAGKPGKTEFPADWDDKKIVDALSDVARRLDLPPRRQEWNDRWVARGIRDDVGIVVVIARDGSIRTGWPTADSPGVVKNPKEP
jgi:Bacterial EndoU nuclease